MATQAVYYRAVDGAEPVMEFLDREFPLTHGAIDLRRVGKGKRRIVVRQAVEAID